VFDAFVMFVPPAPIRAPLGGFHPLKFHTRPELRTLIISARYLKDRITCAILTTPSTRSSAPSGGASRGTVFRKPTIGAPKIGMSKSIEMRTHGYSTQAQP